MSKAQHQDVYRLHDEPYGSIRPDTGAGTSNEYANLKRQVSALSKNMDKPLTM